MSEIKSSDSKKQQLLFEVEADIRKYRRARKASNALQWTVLILVTIAGFFTTAAGTVDKDSESSLPWFATQKALTAWGLTATIGSMIIQNAKPAQMAEQFEKKKDAMRSIRTALKFRNMELDEAARLIEIARAEPAHILNSPLDK